MKIAILSAASAVHTLRWVNGLASIGHEVMLISAHKLSEELPDKIHWIQLPFRAPWGYYLNVSVLKKILQEYKPDILNAHFASGYGTLARLSGYSPYMLSVWGSDVYDFPLKSRLHRKLVTKNIAAADSIASTSYCMLEVTNNLFHNPKTFVTPFGIDENLFSVKKETKSLEIIIGTVKTMASKYGIDTLLQSFKILLENLKRNDVYLEITGDGPDKTKLERYAIELGISDRVRFFGNVGHAYVVEKLHRMDIYVALSRLDSESFGVAILEASSCGLPVIVSDVAGLKEVTKHMETGIIVNKESPEDAARAMGILIEDSELRKTLGENGRKHVLQRYTWAESLKTMTSCYERTIAD